MDVASMPTDAVDRREDRPDPAPPDAALVRRALGGDLESFGRLYDRYVRLVHATCFDAAGEANTAEDLVHETFVRAHGSLHRLRNPGKFAPWLLGIAHRACKDWRRKRARELKHLGPLAAWRGTDQGTDTEPLEALRMALLKLPNPERTAIHLFYLEDQPIERAQEVLNLSRSGFYKLLERARKKLRKLLTEEEGPA
jgi:RNA polymerase sigma-70 factor, ECF subfamily